LPRHLNWKVDSPAEGCSIAAGIMHCDAGTIQPGHSFRAHISTPTSDANCRKMINKASASAQNALSSSNRDSITVLCPHIDVVKTPDSSTVDAGKTLGFTIKVTNAGPGRAYGVEVTDELPKNAGLAWSIDGGSMASDCSIAAGKLFCAPGTLPAGASLTVHLS